MTHDLDLINQELKVLAVSSKTSKERTLEHGQSLSKVLEYLNLHRLSKGLDTLGQGYYPIEKEEAVTILWFTDGGTYKEQESLHVSPLDFPGAEIYKEPFRWDQRLCTFLLSPAISKIPSTEPMPTSTTIQDLCHSMAGNYWPILNLYHLFQVIDNAFFSKTPHLGVLPSSRMNHWQSNLYVYFQAWNKGAAQGQAEKLFGCYLSPGSATNGFPLPEDFLPLESMLSAKSGHLVMVFYVLQSKYMQRR